MRLLQKSVKMIPIFILAVSLLGCGDDDAKIPEVTAGFTSSINELTGEVTFTNTSSETAKTFAWNFGDGATSTEKDPKHTYVNGDYTVKLTASVSSVSDEFTEEITISIEEVDGTAPVITLLGDNPVNLTVGGEYADAGATATDNVDGDITADIVVGGTYTNTETAGEFTITYNVSDEAGNAATEVTRNVVVAAGVECTAETEESMSAADLNMTFQTDQSSNVIEDGGDFEWSDNPDATGINTSCKVGKITKLGANPWDNNQIDLDAKLDFDNNSGLKMKVYSGVAGFKVRVKLEEIGNAGNNTELEVATTKTNEWEELEFPFAASHSNKFDKVVLFFDLNANNTDTYYFDDLTLYGEGSGGTGGGTGTLIVDFENALTGIAKGQFGGNVAADLVANPVSGGINTSANVLQIAYAASSDWWGGTELDFGTGVLDASATVYKAKLYSTVANSKVLFEVETASQVGTTGEVKTIVNANEWVEVTFTMPNPPSEVNRIIIRPDVSDQSSTKSSDGTLYIDDIVCESCTLGTGGGGGSDTAPTTAAPTPPARDAADVISLFSDAYTNININSWSTDWDDSSQEDIQVEGNNTKKISFGNFLGVDFVDNRIDATNFTHFHIDVWTETETLDKTFNHKFSNHANTDPGETSAIEFSTNNGSNPALPNPNPGTWISYDIPLSSWTVAATSLDREAIAQYIISSNLGVVYVDNIYLYK